MSSFILRTVVWGGASSFMHGVISRVLLIMWSAFAFFLFYACELIWCFWTLSKGWWASDGLLRACGINMVLEGSKCYVHCSQWSTLKFTVISGKRDQCSFSTVFVSFAFIRDWKIPTNTLSYPFSLLALLLNYIPYPLPSTNLIFVRFIFYFRYYLRGRMPPLLVLWLLVCKWEPVIGWPISGISNDPFYELQGFATFTLSTTVVL